MQSLKAPIKRYGMINPAGHANLSILIFEPELFG
jgi:hypothetical protein